MANAKLRMAWVLAVAVAGVARGANYTPTSGSATLVASATSGSAYHTEGPIYDGNGNILFCELNTSHANDTLWSYNIANKTNGIVVSSSGGTQGDFFTSGGLLVTADRDTRQVSTRSLSSLSSASAIASTYGGKQFNGPNDLVVDSAGGVYFTDPNFENFSNNQGVDGVYYITSTTTGATVSRVLSFTNGTDPNGIIISPDQKTLYVDLWTSGTIMAYPITSSGVLGTGHTFVSTIHPDGMTIDQWGNVIVARNGGVTCYNPSGSILFDVSTADSGATNVELAPSSSGEMLFITAGTSLYAVSLTGAPEPASLAILGGGLALLICRRNRRQHSANRVA